MSEIITQTVLEETQNIGKSISSLESTEKPQTETDLSKDGQTSPEKVEKITFENPESLCDSEDNTPIMKSKVNRFQDLQINDCEEHDILQLVDKFDGMKSLRGCLQVKLFESQVLEKGIKGEEALKTPSNEGTNENSTTDGQSKQTINLMSEQQIQSEREIEGSEDQTIVEGAVFDNDVEEENPCDDEESEKPLESCIERKISSDDDEIAKENDTIPEEGPQKITDIPTFEFSERVIPVVPEKKRSEFRDEESLAPTYSGYLKKRSSYLVWNTKWVQLKNSKLLFYHPKQQHKLQGCIDFNLVEAAVEIEGNPVCSSTLRIKVKGLSNNFYFKAASNEELYQWLDVIKLHIQASDKQRASETPRLLLNNLFWQRISNAKFTSMVESGDLLLFKTKKFLAKVQRSFTMSSYDHVAMLLRYRSGDIILFEATSRDGVGLCRWTTFVEHKWHELYDRMVYRKLEMERTDGTIKTIERFVRSALGKKYGVSPAKLMKKYSTVKPDAGGVTKEEEQTFFCSELIAACYKRLGILPPHISSAQYWPGSFSGEKKLNLLEGAKLSDEMLLDFKL